MRIVDFERAAMVSLKTIFNNVRIRGWWFHNSQAMRRKVGEFGKLINIFNSSINVY